MTVLYPAERASNIACRLSIYPWDDTPPTRIADRTFPVAFVAFPPTVPTANSIYIRISDCVLTLFEKKKEEGRKERKGKEMERNRR